LIKVRLRDNQRSWPLDLLLVLHVQLSDLNGLRSIDLVLRNKLRRRQLKNVQTACDFGAVDMAVVPVSRPVAAKDEHVWINWSTIEVADLNRMLRVGEVYERDAALIPRLHEDIATGNRNERPV